MHYQAQPALRRTLEIPAKDMQRCRESIMNAISGTSEEVTDLFLDQCRLLE